MRIKSLAVSIAITVVAAASSSQAEETASTTKTQPQTKEKQHSVTNAKHAKKASTGSLSQRGQMIYKEYDCASCHSIRGNGCKNGVPLDDVARKRNKQFLVEHLTDPEAHVAKNPKAFQGDPNMMPVPHLNKREIDYLIAYLQSLSKNRKLDAARP